MVIRGPYKKSKDKHSKQITVFFTPAEYEEITAEAKVWRLPLARLIRESMFREIRK